MNSAISSSGIRWKGAWYFAEHRIRVMSKWKLIIGMIDFANPLFYLIAVGVGIGVLVTENSGTTGTGGVEYLTFLAPALVASAAISAAIDETMFPTLEGFKWRKTFYGANSAPLTGNQIAAGVFIAAMARVFFSVTLYWLVLVIFKVLKFSSLPIIFTAALGGAAFGAALMGFVGKVHNDDLFMSAFSRMVVTPLFLFSGTFFPLSSMPTYFQPIGWISPLWHAAELGRHFAYGYEISALMLILHFAFLIAVFVLGIRFSGRQFTRRLLK